MHLYSGAQSSAELQPYKSLIMTSSLTRYLQIQTLKKYLTNWDRRFWISPESCYWDWGLKKAWSLRLEFFFPIWVDESPAASNKHTDFPHRLLCRWPQFLVFLKRKWYATSKTFFLPHVYFWCVSLPSVFKSYPLASNAVPHSSSMSTLWIFVGSLQAPGVSST